MVCSRYAIFYNNGFGSVCIDFAGVIVFSYVLKSCFCEVGDWVADDFGVVNSLMMMDS